METTLVRHKLLGGVLFTKEALAATDIFIDCPSDEICNPLKFGTVPEILSAIANFLFTISIPIAVIFIIIGGFQFATAAGNPEKINAGKRTITWAVIGIVVLLVAGSIAKLIENILT